MNTFYFIKNIINDYGNTIIVGYFKSQKEAEEALKKCHDYFMPDGTGKIYVQEFGLNKKPKLVKEVNWNEPS